MIIRGGRWFVLPAVAVLVGLSACTGGSAPPPQTSTATVTPSVTSASPSGSPAPTLPAAAQQPTRAGAEAFLRYFFAVYSYSFESLDSEALRRLSDPSCKFCNSAIESVRAGEAKGQHTVGGALSVTTVLAAPGNSNDRMIVNAVVDQESGQIVQGDGVVVRVVPPRKALRVDAAVRWAGGHWIMLDVRVQKPGP